MSSVGRRVRLFATVALCGALVGCTTPRAPAPEPTPTASAEGSACASPTVTVSTSSQLWDALEEAGPGTSIQLAPGIYVGQFVATGVGTKEQPIALCGPSEAILDGGGVDDGYVLHLDSASNWIIEGFTIRNGQKGLMADGLTHSTIRALTVSEIGDEAVHLRRFSTDNVIEANTIFDTGLRKPKYGEGIYIGTAESNWCDITACEPDKSDRNMIRDNNIARTTAESVDVKEGTSEGVVSGNTFDGTLITGADSWVDIKGNNWLVEGNVGTTSPLDGFQTHEVVDGWGTGNIFRANTANVNGSGFGFSLTPELDNVVECGNTASGAGEGVSTAMCTSS